LGDGLCPYQLYLSLDSSPSLYPVHERNAAHATPLKPKSANGAPSRLSYFIYSLWTVPTCLE
jgi:hypothetical protein